MPYTQEQDKNSRSREFNTLIGSKPHWSIRYGIFILIIVFITGMTLLALTGSPEVHTIIRQFLHGR